MVQELDRYLSVGGQIRKDPIDLSPNLRLTVIDQTTQYFDQSFLNHQSPKLLFGCHVADDLERRSIETRLVAEYILKKDRKQALLDHIASFAGLHAGHGRNSPVAISLNRRGK